MLRKIIRFFSLIVFLMIQINQTMAQIKPFVPSDFKVPDKFENQHFRLRMLSVNDVVKDYDAVMTSIDHLQGVCTKKLKEMNFLAKLIYISEI